MLPVEEYCYVGIRGSVRGCSSEKARYVDRSGPHAPKNLQEDPSAAVLATLGATEAKHRPSTATNERGVHVGFASGNATS